MESAGCVSSAEHSRTGEHKPRHFVTGQDVSLSDSDFEKDPTAKSFWGLGLCIRKTQRRRPNGTFFLLQMCCSIIHNLGIWQDPSSVCWFAKGSSSQLCWTKAGKNNTACNYSYFRIIEFFDYFAEKKGELWVFSSAVYDQKPSAQQILLVLALVFGCLWLFFQLPCSDKSKMIGQRCKVSKT